MTYILGISQETTNNVLHTNITTGNNIQHARIKENCAYDKVIPVLAARTAAILTAKVAYILKNKHADRKSSTVDLIFQSILPGGWCKYRRHCDKALVTFSESCLIQHTTFQNARSIS